MARRILVLTDGYSDVHTAKTAIGVIRYKPEDVVAVLDSHSAGRTSQDVLGVGGAIPVVGSLTDAPEANTLLIGIAPPGGKIPETWRPIVLDAIRRKMNVVSGLHDFLCEDAEFAAAAAEHGADLVDVRKNDERDVASGEGIRCRCLRLLTVANDCSCGKMVAAIEVARGLARAGIDAKFLGTGQTGIMIEGDGCPVDRVVSDFVSGAVEKLVLAHQHHDVLVFEGQGSLVHPRYSCVTLGLLHGAMPHGMILCYEMGRTAVFGMEHVPLPPLAAVKEFNEAAANVMFPSKTIGIAVNGYRFSDAEVDAECARVSDQFGLPACDVYRHGPAKLVDAVTAFQRELKL